MACRICPTERRSSLAGGVAGALLLGRPGLRHLQRRSGVAGLAIASLGAEFIGGDFGKFEWLVRGSRRRGRHGIGRAEVERLFDRRQCGVGRFAGLGLGRHGTPLVLAAKNAARIPPACGTVNQL